MKLRSIAVAALAALTLAACSKDGEKGGGDPVDEGEETSFTFSFTLPGALNKAGETQVGTEVENKIGDSVYIYVFNMDGTPAAGDCFKAASLASDFTETVTGTYVLKEKMNTKSGDKKVYVAANLESTEYHKFATFAPANEAALQAVVDVSADILNGNPLASIAMIGMTKAKLAVADYDNLVDVGLERAVSRVIVTSEDATLEADWSALGAQDLTFDVQEFFVVQDAYKSHFSQKYNSAGYKTSYLSTAPSWNDAIHPYSYYVNGTAPYNVGYAPIVPDGTDNTRQNIAGFYIGENVANNENDVARYGSATYAYIKTRLELENSAEIVDNGSGDEIEYSGVKIDNNVEGFILIRTNGFDDIICVYEDGDSTVVNSITDYLQTVEGFDPQDIRTYIYRGNYVYFRLFLGRNNTGVEKYNVYRNEFFHLLVEGVNIEPGDFGTTYPGKDDDEETPIDPNEDDGNNPNPPDEGGETPIDEDDATLRISISVKPWTYKAEPLNLGEEK